ncbi:MAG: twin-arginine translocase subunit TatC [Candidatus Omnitrophica bacterium]|nr:twin-arginine translocase subunit TatC [Candidatus Omnitrophota bacterium]
MSSLHSEETKKIDVISHLEEVRRRVLFCVIVLVLATIGAFSWGEAIMSVVTAPIQKQVSQLIFIAPTEAFVAFLKVSILAGFIASFPFILYHAWRFLSPAFQKRERRRISMWLLSSLFLFFAGIAFAYFIVIPAALEFLLNFNREVASPQITLGKYVSFFTALIIVGGIVFEIPVVMGLLTDAGILKTAVLRKKRHYALIVILMFAAIITPTQDIVNMLLFAVPMILLYEIGILISRIIESRKSKDQDLEQ